MLMVIMMAAWRWEMVATVRWGISSLHLTLVKLCLLACLLTYFELVVTEQCSCRQSVSALCIWPEWKTSHLCRWSLTFTILLWDIFQFNSVTCAGRCAVDACSQNDGVDVVGAGGWWWSYLWSTVTAGACVTTHTHTHTHTTLLSCS